jgi:hypothetical protein
MSGGRAVNSRRPPTRASYGVISKADTLVVPGDPVLTGTPNYVRVTTSMTASAPDVGPGARHHMVGLPEGHKRRRRRMGHDQPHVRGPA